MRPQRNRSGTSIHSRLSKEQLRKLLEKRRAQRDDTLQSIKDRSKTFSQRRSGGERSSIISNDQAEKSMIRVSTGINKTMIEDNSQAYKWKTKFDLIAKK